jgi:hypothetical protein
MSFQKKYLKYKEKYLDLKNQFSLSQLGGTDIFFKEYFNQILQNNIDNGYKTKFNKDYKFIISNTELNDLENIYSPCLLDFHYLEIFFHQLYIYLFNKIKIEIISHIDSNNNNIIIPLLTEVNKFCIENNCIKKKLLVHEILDDEEYIKLQHTKDISILTEKQKKRLKRILIIYKLNKDFISIKFFNEFLYQKYSNKDFQKIGEDGIEMILNEEKNSMFISGDLHDKLNEKDLALYKNKYKELNEESLVIDVCHLLVMDRIENILEDCDKLCTVNQKKLQDITINDILNTIKNNISNMILDAKNVIEEVFITDKESRIQILDDILLTQNIFKHIDENNNYNDFLNIVSHINSFEIKYNNIDLINIEEIKLPQLTNLDTSVLYHPNVGFFDNENYFRYFGFCHEIGHEIINTKYKENSIIIIKINDVNIKIKTGSTGFPDVEYNGIPTNDYKNYNLQYNDLFADLISVRCLINKLEKEINDKEKRKMIIYNIFNSLTGNISHFNPDERLYYNSLLNDKLKDYFI